MPKLNPHLQNPSKSLYQQDYLQWIERTIAQLQHQNYDQVEWEHLIEEIKDRGRSERRGLESNLIVVLLHLLKWQYQPDRRSGSWEGSILKHRRRINKALEDSPSLQPYLQTILAESYTAARKQAKAETGLMIETFPTECAYSLSDLLDDDFLSIGIPESIPDMD